MANVKHYKEVPALPKEYTECEYLESTGTQWIDTLFVHDHLFDQLKFDFDFYYNHINNTDRCVSGFRSAYNTLLSTAGKMVNIYAGSYEIKPSVPKSYQIHNTRIHQIHTFVKQNNTYEKKLFHEVIGGGYYEDSILLDGNLDVMRKSMPLFAYCNANTIGWFFTGRIYRYEIEVDYTKYRHFIPALDPQGRPCMYDLVSQQPFYNQGTGEFLYKIAEKPTMKLVPMVQMYHKGVPYFKDKVLKPKLPEEYQEVEYLESTGTQYIFTDIYQDESKDYNVRLSYVGNAVNNARPFFAWINKNTNGVTASSSEGKIYLRLSDEVAASIAYDNDVHTYHYDAATQMADIDGSTFGIKRTLQFSTPWCFFAMNYSGRAAYYAKARIYASELNDEENVVIPCYRKSDKVAGLYVTGEEVFYVNQGTGEFIVGPDKDTMIEVEDNTAIVGLYSKGEVVRDMTPRWMKDAVAEYGIPLENLKKAYEEFPDVKYCFVDEGKTPWLKGDGKAVIDTGCKLSKDIKVRMYIRASGKDASNAHYYGIRYQDSAVSKGTFCLSKQYVYGNPNITKVDFPIEENVFVEHTIEKCSYNGEIVRNVAHYDIIESSNIHLFGSFNEKYNRYDIPTSSKISVFAINGVKNIVLVPFPRNAVYGMIDLLSMEFHENVNTSGSFTYSLE